MTDTKRRDVIKALAAGSLAVAKPVKAGWSDWLGRSDASPETLEVINNVHFTDQNGKTVTIKDDILPDLKGKPFTLSFAWAGCSQAHKPMHQTLSGLEAIAPDVVHVVIDTVALDNIGQHSRDGLMWELKETGGMKTPIIILYPDTAKLAEIQSSIGLLPMPNPLSIVSVGLYGRDGKKIGFKSTGQNPPDSIINEWKQSLSISKGR